MVPQRSGISPVLPPGQGRRPVGSGHLATSLVARARHIPAISFVEQPPTYAQAYEVQRFQSALSSFTLVWNYLAIVAFIFWLLFYVR